MVRPISHRAVVTAHPSAVPQVSKRSRPPEDGDAVEPIAKRTRSSTQAASRPTPLPGPTPAVHRVPPEIWDNIVAIAEQQDSASVDALVRVDKHLAGMLTHPASPHAMACLRGAFDSRMTMSQVFALLNDPRVAPILARATWLEFSNKNMTPKELDDLCTRLAEKCPKLDGIGLRSNDVQAESIPSLGKLPNLRKADLAFNDIGDLGAQHLARLPLTRVALSHTELTAAGVGALSRMPTLQRLSALSCELDDEAVAPLENARGLRHLYLSGNNLEAGSIATFAKLSLEGLNVSNNLMWDAAAPHFAKMTTLKVLYANACGLGVAFGAALENLTGLQELSVSDNRRIGDSMSKALGGMEKLDGLLAANCGITAQGVEAIGQCTSLTLLEIGGNRFGDDAFANIAKLTALETLGVSQTLTSHKGLAWIKCLPELRRLLAAENYYTSKVGKPIRRMRKLTELHLKNNALSPRAAQDIFTLPALKLLYMRNCRLTDRSFDRVRGRRFDELDLSENHLTDRAAVALAGVHATRLNLKRNALTAKSLPSIAKIEGLRRVDLSENPIERLDGIEGATGLRVLDLRGTKLQADKLAPLKRLVDLRTFFLDETAMPQGDEFAAMRANFKYLKYPTG